MFIVRKWTLLVLLTCIASVAAVAQTWSAPQFLANGLGVAVSTNGSTSAVLFMPPSGGLQASVKNPVVAGALPSR